MNKRHNSSISMKFIFGFLAVALVWSAVLAWGAIKTADFTLVEPLLTAFGL